MSNKIRPWRKKDRKHYKRKVKFSKAKKLPIKIVTIDDTPWDVKLDNR